MLKVWDLFVRISHWLIVLLVVSAYLTANYGDSTFKWHSLNGYAIFVLVLSRVIWGVVGSSTSRFSQFIKSPFQVFYYLRNLLRGNPPNYIGHNPAGGWMVAILWLVLLSQAITGLFSSDDILAEGPLSYTVSASIVSTMTSLHHLFFSLLIGLVVLHIVAVIYHQWVKKEKLIQAMFHGKKLDSSDDDQRINNFIWRPFYFALIILVTISLLFYYSLKDYL